MKQRIERDGRQVGLDLVRVFAALAVMTFHLGYWIWASPHPTASVVNPPKFSYPELAPLTTWGWVGVEIFFVISGFVIAYSASHGDPLAVSEGADIAASARRGDLRHDYCGGHFGRG